jgi:hypothetical protein
VAYLGGEAAATAAGLGALNAIPIIGTIAAAALLPFMIITAHHAAAVAKEQGTLCACTGAINQWLDTIDAAVAGGQVSPAEGNTAMSNLEAQFEQCVSPISAACTPGNVNAACVYRGHMRAQVLLRQWMYSNLAVFNPAGSQSDAGTSGATEAITSAPAAVGNLLAGISQDLAGNKSLLYIAIAIAAALLL